MAKKSFSTRFDGDVLDVAQRLAEMERRSLTALIEIAVLDYGERRGVKVKRGQEEQPTGEDRTS